MKIHAIPILLITAFLTAGCDEEKADPGPDPIRAIKYMKLEIRAGLQSRRIAGKMAADITSNVAFETGGQIIEILRAVGDRVSEGELLARLDPEPLNLAVSQAKGELGRALASAEDAARKFAQQKQLFDRGFATRTAFDTAEANLKTAEGAVAVARSSLERAQRDLKRAELRAPFDGVIATQSAEVFEEVMGGQAIMAMQTDAGGKIEASLPETMINQVTLGSKVGVTFPPLGGVATTGTISEISPLTGDANAYPIEVTLDGVPSGLRPGMSAEVVFRFETEATGKAFLVPLAAVLPLAGSDDDALVYVFDPGSKTVAPRKVTVANVEGNSLEIIGQLAEGEIIAVAGVSFLHEGMRVDLFDPKAVR